MITIHQPAPAVFAAFNRLVLLNYGRIAYWGPARTAPLDFFAAQGFPYQQVRCLGVQGAGCRVQGSGFRVQGSGFRVQALGSYSP